MHRDGFGRLKTAILHLACAPWDAAVLCLLLLAWPAGRFRARRGPGALWLDVGPGSLVQRRWRYSTTLGHLVILQPGLAGSYVERHELVHVRQFEGAVCSVWCCAGLWLSLSQVLGTGWAAMAVLLLGPWWSYLGGSAAAFLRGGRPYLDNHFERHARAECPAPDQRTL